MFLGRHFSSTFASRVVPARYYPINGAWPKQYVSRASITIGTKPTEPGKPSCANNSELHLVQYPLPSIQNHSDDIVGQTHRVPSHKRGLNRNRNHALHVAFTNQDRTGIDTAIKALIKLYRRDSASRLSIFHEILDRDDLDIVQPQTLVALLQLIRSSPFEVLKLSSTSVHNILRLEPSASYKLGDDSLSRIVFRLVLDYLRARPVPSGVQALEYSPSPGVKRSFGYLGRLITSSQQDALELYNLLVETGHIPEDVIADESVSFQNDVDLILSAVVRAADHWGWAKVAIRFLHILLKNSNASPESITDLIQNTLFSIFENSIDRDPERNLRACLSVIIEVHALKPVADTIIHQFYNLAHQYNLGADAELLYAFTRKFRVADAHQYPTPHGPALGWFMRYLTQHTRRTYLCRQLAKDVVEGNIPIPVQQRAEFIYNTASAGNSLPARSIWERYAIGKDKHVVVGDPSVLISMVRLFHAIARRTEAQIQSHTLDRSDESPESPVPVVSTTWGTDRSNGFNSPSHWGSSFQEVDADLHKRLSDISSFQEKLLREYKDSNQPLTNVHHRVLTSYARACFIVGDFKEGFNTFKIFLLRKELPDRYDLNIALGAIARWNPRTAANLIDRMTEKGLKPDETTLGTVMNQAIVHADFELVDFMAERINHWNITDLTDKTVAGLIKAYATPRPNDSREDQILRLRKAMKVTRSWMSSSSLSVIVTETGRFVIAKSLQAEDPTMAFKFWKMMLERSSVGDTQHAKLRASIAHMIRHDCQHNRLPQAKGHFMLEQLGYRKDSG